MEELRNYLKTHTYFLRYLDKHHISSEVEEVLNKYKFSFHELCYRIKNDIPLDKVFTCKQCGKNLVYTNKHGYTVFCSQKCSGEYILSLDITKVKMKQTCLKKYGTDSYSKTREFKDYIKKHKDEIQSKSQETFKDKYGVAYYSQTQEYKDKVKQTCLDRYGVTSYTKTKECRDRINQTCIDKYGVKRASQMKEFKDKAKQTCLDKYGVNSYSKTVEYKAEAGQKVKQTCLDKYGVDSYIKTHDFKVKSRKTCLKKYGIDNYAKTKKFKDFMEEHKKEIQNKVYLKKKQNNSFNKSKFEEKTYNLLLTKFTKEDIERQYKSEKYPFACDFYIKSKDLYIECNGHWSHGNKKGLGSFDKNNQKHLDVLAKWQDKAKTSKFFQKAIYVWTDLDVRKLETFKKNKLNYKIFWNISEVEAWLKEVN